MAAASEADAAHPKNRAKCDRGTLGNLYTTRHQRPVSKASGNLGARAEKGASRQTDRQRKREEEKKGNVG